MNSSFAILEQSSWIKRQRVALFYHVMAINTNCLIVNYCTVYIPFCWTFDNPCYFVDKCVICTYKLFFIFDNWMFLLRTCFFFLNIIIYAERNFERGQIVCVCLDVTCERVRDWYELIRELFCSLYIMYMLWSNKDVLPI